MLPFLLTAIVAVLLYYGGADRFSQWLFPAFPPAIGGGILIGSLILVTTLLITSTRMLAQSLIVGTISFGLRLTIALLYGVLSAFRSTGTLLTQSLRSLLRRTP
jgi:hypothetical protein